MLWYVTLPGIEEGKLEANARDGHFARYIGLAGSGDTGTGGTYTAGEEARIAALVTAGRIELDSELDEIPTTGVNVRLPDARMVDLLLDEMLVDLWRAVRGRLGLRSWATELRRLLTAHATAAAARDPLAALYTALVAAQPNIDRRVGHDTALRLAELTTVLDGPLDLPQVLRTVCALSDFAGEDADLVDVIAAVLAPAA